MEWLLSVILAGSSAAYGALAALTIRALRKLVMLNQLSPPEPARWPKLAVIVPACNEAQTLRDAMKSVLSQDYPALEIVLIDDRSTDGTKELVDEIARADSRVRPIHIETLPEGWLGKVHALHVGSSQTDAEWLLFTDADVHFAPGVIQKAVALAAAENLKHVAVLPHTIAKEFLLEVALTAFAVGFFWSTRAHEVGDPKKDAYAGVGAFNMVHAETLKKAGGLEWIRLEIADDMGLALLMKKAGAKARLLLARDEIAVEWYPSLRAMVKGLEKNLFAVAGRFALWRSVVQLVFLVLPALSPMLAILAVFSSGGSSPWVVGSGLCAMGLSAACSWQLHRALGFRFGATLLLPLGLVTVAGMLARSSWIATRQQSVHWRGTHYPIEKLRAAQRVKI